MIKTIVYRMKEEALKGKRPSLNELTKHLFGLVLSEIKPEKIESFFGVPRSEWDQLVVKTLRDFKLLEAE